MDVSPMSFAHQLSGWLSELSGRSVTEGDSHE